MALTRGRGARLPGYDLVHFLFRKSPRGEFSAETSVQVGEVTI